MEAELYSETLVLTYPSALCVPQNTGNLRNISLPARKRTPILQSSKQ